MLTNAHYDANSRRRLHLSRHAERRCQQRGISPDCVPLIRSYGERSYDGQGAVRYLMTGASIASLQRALGRLPQLEELRGRYIVVDADDESVVITAGHRH